MSSTKFCCRSNYFHVKDGAEFESRMGELGVIVHDAGSRGYLITMSEEKSWPAFEDVDAPSPVVVAFAAEIADRLVDGSVAILMEIGHNKLKFLEGTALAVNSAHQERLVTLDDIYKLAAPLAFGGVVSRAEG